MGVWASSMEFRANSEMPSITSPVPFQGQCSAKGGLRYGFRSTVQLASYHCMPQGVVDLQPDGPCLLCTGVRAWIVRVWVMSNSRHPFKQSDGNIKFDGTFTRPLILC